jgi:2-keto-4-pentenoate hydratase/2-oxohepta-3-ene-1,7-dioic acid hydratase in catechol pathway
MTYSLALIRGPEGPLAVIENEGILFALSDIVPDIETSLHGGTLALFEKWDSVLADIDAALSRESDLSPCARAGEAEFLAPVQRPANIICAGSNYYDHLAKDFGITGFDKARNDILYFAKQAGSLVGPGKTVRYPSQ